MVVLNPAQDQANDILLFGLCYIILNINSFTTSGAYAPADKLSFVIA